MPKICPVPVRLLSLSVFLARPKSVTLGDRQMRIYLPRGLATPEARQFVLPQDQVLPNSNLKQGLSAMLASRARMALAPTDAR